MGKTGDLILGHSFEYWMTLQQRAEELKVVDLIEEIAKLRGKLQFYESRIEQMESLRKIDL